MNDITYLPTHLDLPPSLSPLTALASPEVVSAVFDALADAVVVYDREGRIVGSNPAAVTLFGLTRSDGQATFANAFSERTLGGEQLLPLDGPAMRVLRGETLQGAQTMDVAVHALGGRELTVNVSGAPLLDTEGPADRFLNLFPARPERPALRAAPFLPVPSRAAPGSPPREGPHPVQHGLDSLFLPLRQAQRLRRLGVQQAVRPPHLADDLLQALRLVRPQDLGATVYHALGVPLDTRVGARPITAGEPILELFS